jgi:RNA polymerase sigma factor (sigma-70 family)
MNPAAPTDPELLTAWLNHRHEAAFRELVARYAGLVQMTAKRTCGDDSLAMETAQLTFIALARKAKALVSCASLGGWLHQTAMLQAKNLLRKSQREHRKRELLQTAMEPPSPAPDDAWQDLQPVLDDALAALSAKDREALLLRFYRSQSVKEIAATLGIATAAAQKRVDRATDRLRAKLLRRSCQAGGSLSAVMLAGFAGDSQAAVVAVPLITAKAIAAGAAGSGVIATTTAFLTATAMKTTAVAVPLVVLLALGIWLTVQTGEIAGLEAENSWMEKQLIGVRDKTALTDRIGSFTVLDRKPVDWEELARQVRRYGPKFHLTSSAPLVDRVRTMDVEELTRMLDEIMKASVSKESKLALESWMADEIGNVNARPDLVLDKLAERIGEDEITWTLGRLFKSWLDHEPDQAIAWLANNYHRAKSIGRGFMNVSFYPLLASSPAQAKLLVAAVPAEHRLNSLRAAFPESAVIPANRYPEWAAIAREMSGTDVQNAIVWPIQRQYREDARTMNLEEIDHYLTDIQATAQERELCVIAAASAGAIPAGEVDVVPFTPEWVESFRAWTSGQSMDLATVATGRALSASVPQMAAGQAVELAIRYYRESPDDALLHPLISKCLILNDLINARKLVDSLADEHSRRGYLDTINSRNP